ncbi:hypothetical protein K488DRAFT_71800 [Vararia minispora EC-137]|uniref:Uncharacterized protein n=1 Tax=Vararia minispora EC-137 TaxID=1314806 RepID=A0ACB8QI09_9AGAM|nr:hypothetical protein K488DRAFT_71800 [Vararia minispora EC-137]
MSGAAGPGGPPLDGLTFTQIGQPPKLLSRISSQPPKPEQSVSRSPSSDHSAPAPDPSTQRKPGRPPLFESLASSRKTAQNHPVPSAHTNADSNAFATTQHKKPLSSSSQPPSSLTPPAESPAPAPKAPVPPPSSLSALSQALPAATAPNVAERGGLQSSSDTLQATALSSAVPPRSASVPKQNSSSPSAVNTGPVSGAPSVVPFTSGEIGPRRLSTSVQPTASQSALESKADPSAVTVTMTDLARTDAPGATTSNSTGAHSARSPPSSSPTHAVSRPRPSSSASRPRSTTLLPTPLLTASLGLDSDPAMSLFSTLKKRREGLQQVHNTFKKCARDWIQSVQSSSTAAAALETKVAAVLVRADEARAQSDALVAAVQSAQALAQQLRSDAEDVRAGAESVAKEQMKIRASAESLSKWIPLLEHWDSETAGKEAADVELLRTELARLENVRRTAEERSRTAEGRARDEAARATESIHELEDTKKALTEQLEQAKRELVKVSKQLREQRQQRMEDSIRHGRQKSLERLQQQAPTPSSSLTSLSGPSVGGIGPPSDGAGVLTAVSVGAMFIVIDIGSGVGAESRCFVTRRGGAACACVLAASSGGSRFWFCTCPLDPVWFALLDPYFSPSALIAPDIFASYATAITDCTCPGTLIRTRNFATARTWEGTDAYTGFRTSADGHTSTISPSTRGSGVRECAAVASCAGSTSFPVTQSATPSSMFDPPAHVPQGSQLRQPPTAAFLCQAQEQRISPPVTKSPSLASTQAESRLRARMPSAETEVSLGETSDRAPHLDGIEDSDWPVDGAPSGRPTGEMNRPIHSGENGGPTHSMPSYPLVEPRQNSPDLLPPGIQQQQTRRQRRRPKIPDDRYTSQDPEASSVSSSSRQQSWDARTRVPAKRPFDDDDHEGHEEHRIPPPMRRRTQSPHRSNGGWSRSVSPPRRVAHYDLPPPGRAADSWKVSRDFESQHSDNYFARRSREPYGAPAPGGGRDRAGMANVYNESGAGSNRGVWSGGARGLSYDRPRDAGKNDDWAGIPAERKKKRSYYQHEAQGPYEYDRGNEPALLERMGLRSSPPAQTQTNLRDRSTQAGRGQRGIGRGGNSSHAHSQTNRTSYSSTPNRDANRTAPQRDGTRPVNQRTSTDRATMNRANADRLTLAERMVHQGRLEDRLS